MHDHDQKTAMVAALCYTPEQKALYMQDAHFHATIDVMAHMLIEQVEALSIRAFYEIDEVKRRIEDQMHRGLASLQEMKEWGL